MYIANNEYIKQCGTALINASSYTMTTGNNNLTSEVVGDQGHVMLHSCIMHRYLWLYEFLASLMPSPISREKRAGAYIAH